MLALISGAALTLAFEPYAFSVLIPFCLAGLLVATRGMRARSAWIPGLAFGAAFMGSLTAWFTAIGPDAWVGVTLVESLYFAVLGLGLGLVQRLPWWPIWAAALWVAVESVRIGWPFSGLPWGRLSYGVADSWWADALPYLGFTLVSLLLALTGAYLAWLITGGWRRPLLALGAVAALGAVTVVPVLLPYDVSTDGTAVVAVVQGDVPGDGTNVLYDHRQVTANQRDVTQQVSADVAAGRVAEPDFVVWPENSTAIDPFRNPDVNSTIQEASDAIGVPILVGALVDGVNPDTVLNQGIVWEPGIGATDRYSKWHPVPFGEYIPWRGQGLMKRFENFGRLQEIRRDMPAGSRTAPLRIGDVDVVDSICFDVAYDDVYRSQLRAGGRMIVVQTSNAMFINTDQIDQQFEITRLRALATGRSLAVSSTNGLTGVIDPRGQVQARAAIRTQSALVEEVPLSSTITPGVLIGAWSAWVTSALALMALAVALLGGRRFPYSRRRINTFHEGRS